MKGMRAERRDTERSRPTARADPQGGQGGQDDEQGHSQESPRGEIAKKHHEP